MGQDVQKAIIWKCQSSGPLDFGKRYRTGKEQQCTHMNSPHLAGLPWCSLLQSEETALSDLQGTFPGLLHSIPRKREVA